MDAEEQNDSQKQEQAAEASLPRETALAVVSLALQMSDLLVLCAPRFAEGSEGARIMRLAVDSRQHLQKMAKDLTPKEGDQAK